MINGVATGTLLFPTLSSQYVRVFHRTNSCLYQHKFTLQPRAIKKVIQNLNVYYHKPVIKLPNPFIHLNHFNFVTTSYKMAEAKYVADYDKRGQASCKKCKQKIGKGLCRIAKVVPNFFHDGDGEMKQYYHPSCIMETFVRARATTKIIEDHTDVEGFKELQDEDKDIIKKHIKELMDKKSAKKTPKKTTPKGAAQKKTIASPALPFSPVKKVAEQEASGSPSLSVKVEASDKTGEASTSTEFKISDEIADCKDNAFRQFRRVAADVAEESSYLEKSKIINTFLTKGSCGKGFKGDLYLVLKLLLPGVVKLVYNINSKQLVKVFSQVFATNLDDMVEDLEQGDVAETVKVFFEKSKVCVPQTKSTLTIHEVDALLTELSQFTKEDDQERVLTKMARRSTSNDLKMIVRLIKHDIRINSGAKHVLEGLDPDAYEAFQASRNLRDVVDRVLELRKDGDKPGMGRKKLSVRASVMTPVLPMLAEACKSVEMAFKKCPNGMYAELKYDGERVQVHKQENNFNFYSRSLKPVLPHKVSHFKEWIPKAFPGGSDLILDSEVLLVDTNTSKPLPFGSLGKHKKEQFSDANVCLFIFDCLNYNGTSLMDRPIKERRKFMYENMKEIPNRIMFSEMKHITKASDLKDMMADVFNQGLEGLVLKDVNSLYEPGKRHWLKVKKDYLAEGSMADSADLIVLGGYFGTGSKGGIRSVFLMGCYDSDRGKFLTVTKCGSGFDDKTLERLQKDLEPNMVKVNKDYSKVPSWLNINRGVVPDFIVRDPKISPVWEISGAEFSKAESHTAAGISIRFPRCTKMRDDKTWKEATNLQRLKELVKTSKEKSDFGELLGASNSRKVKKSSVSDNITPPDTDSDTNTGYGTIKMETDDDIRSPSTSAINTPVKRKAMNENDEESSSPTKRQKNDDNKKPICKYGSACYQKNPDHRKKFSHAAAPGVSASDSKGLPDIFHGMKFYLSEGIADVKKFKRYVIAYDGDVVDEYDKETAIQVVDTQDAENKDDSVTAEWLRRCIKGKKVLPKGD